MEKKKIYCSFCHVEIVGNDVVVWRGDKPYHKHHGKFHEVEHKVQEPQKYFVKIKPKYLC